ncbi:TRAP transporter large permease [Halomonas sp. LR5S13]|uniref:TRAP transporter large permease n=1 Tax=Halomonas rhizosphaerae TaxID=3043296 RepID=UPI0024A7BE0D|nr:TRAP transporter large permease [Halomonas rhizosphaerae]MDI5921144.1 TRAP transporter large permease [Halomonas rhizosphaerae]
MAATLLFSMFGALLLFGAPIVVALGVASMAVYILNGDDISSLIELAFSAINSFPLMALPSFILAGALMGDAGIARRLIYIAEELAGPAAGGLGAAAVMACMFFGAISGSGPATTAAVGMLVIPAMIERGYGRSYPAAITATAGGLGVVIPPSMPLVIYGVTANESISALFIAGVIPGVILGMGLMVANYITAKRNGYQTEGTGYDWKRIIKVLKDGFWSLMAPVVILGGIYSGMFTPTEAAVVSIFYALFVGIFIHKESSLRGLNEAFQNTTWLTGRVLIIMFTATAFGRILVENHIPAMIAQGILQITDSLWLVWVLVIGFLLIVGMFIEILATIMIVTPVLLPVMVELGVDPIHFGIVLVVSLGIGFSTPPLGENMFISSSIANVSIERISVRAIPLVGSMVVIDLLLAFFPQISLWLPTVLGY